MKEMEKNTPERKDFNIPEDPRRDWEEDFKYENGNYFCTCFVCKQGFTGHKRRPLCKLCDQEDKTEAERLRKKSISTKKGDEGTTTVLHRTNRVQKSNLMISVIGSLDELYAYISIAHHRSDERTIKLALDEMTTVLTSLMGDIQDPSGALSYTDVTQLQIPCSIMDHFDKQDFDYGEGFCICLGTEAAMAAELARVVCRRAERYIVALADTGHTVNPLILKFINRLSDVLWIVSRKEAKYLYGN